MRILFSLLGSFLVFGAIDGVKFGIDQGVNGGDFMYYALMVAIAWLGIVMLHIATSRD